MAEKLEFDLKVGVNNLSKALSDATNSSKKLGDTVSVALASFGGGLALKGFNALGNAIGSATDFLKDSVRAAAEQEAALNKLSQALRATGSFSAQAVEDFSQFASELQKTSIFGDEVVIGQIAIAKSLGATNAQAKDLVQAAANLSATFGGSLEENVSKLGKTLNGLVNRDLKNAIPELKGLSEESLRSGEALRIVNERFAGAAASELNTYAGRTTELSNAFGDLQEEIGFFITQSESVNSIIKITTGLIQEITQRIVDSNNEQKRANGTLVETEGSLTSLSAKYASVREEIEKYQQVIDADKQKDLLDSLFSFDNAPLARERVQSLTLELQKLDEQITKAAEQVAAQKETSEGGRGERDRTAQEIEKIKTLEAQKTQLINQAELERLNNQAEIINVGIQNDAKRQESELQRILEFETQKKELEFQLAEDKASLIEDRSIREAELTKIGKERELSFAQIANKNLVDNEKLKYKNLQDQAFAFKRYEDQTQKERVDGLRSSFNQIATLSQSGNKTLAGIGKAAAVSSATIDGFVAVNKALASAPPPLNFALAATVGAATAANVARIAGVQFENGGIVGQGATAGADNRVATIRDGEMVLNASQQEALFKAINSGNLGGGNIVVEIDGRAIATAVRSQVQSGFKLGTA
jgi:hypothetical protein